MSLEEHSMAQENQGDPISGLSSLARDRDFRWTASLMGNLYKFSTSGEALRSLGFFDAQI